MKNKFIAIFAAVFIAVTPQLAFSEKLDKEKAKDKAPREDNAPAEDSGSAAGSDATDSAVGGITIGTIAAVIAIAAAAAALADSGSGGSDEAVVPPPPPPPPPPPHEVRRIKILSRGNFFIPIKPTTSVTQSQMLMVII